MVRETFPITPAPTRHFATRSAGRIPDRPPGYTHDLLFLFFSNRLGCLGSLMVSALITVVLLLILGVL
jgi:hypothetical protein